MSDETNYPLQTDIASYWSRWAPFWDILLRLVRLDRRYRNQGVSVLNLAKGMTVLDIACGTGLNFPYLIKAVGPEGRVIAIDIAPGMLERAKQRARAYGWDNCEFIQGDVSRLSLPQADAAAAFWCMISIPDYRMALKNILSALSSGGRLAVLDFKRVDGFPGTFLNPIFERVCRLSHQDVNRALWIDMRLMLENVQVREWRLGGLLMSNVYLAWGQKR